MRGAGRPFSVGHRRPPILAVTVAAVVMSLGAVAAGLSRLDPGPRRVLIPLVSTQRSTAVSATTLTDHRRPPASGVAPRATGAERSVVASPWPSARSRAVAPGDPSRLDSAGESSPAFLAHMTAVLHRRGLPLPGEVGRLQSVIVHATPVATTSGTLAHSRSPRPRSRPRRRNARAAGAARLHAPSVAKTIQAGLKMAPGYGPVSAAATLGRQFSCPGRGPLGHEQLLKKASCRPLQGLTASSVRRIEQDFVSKTRRSVPR